MRQVSAAANLGYSRAAFCVLSLAAYIGAVGHNQATLGLTVPMAVAAGLGELGRNGLLTTRQHGPLRAPGERATAGGLLGEDVRSEGSCGEKVSGVETT